MWSARGVTSSRADLFGGVKQAISVGCPGRRQYRYRATWKDDTIVRMTPLGREFRTGYSDWEKRRTEVFYGRSGPGPLYQRADMLCADAPRPAAIYPDDGALNFWRFD